ncbi:hypothetical protein HPP92_000504 [Vanilla planifolia]|uniref:Exostosin GT47 domain-containing protein n=1 Tax=Vanilla planifolia TaxID=51239 RepID=A0A835S1F8_VANPL|nr:hypothetical protein HPP92_000504 [Vanilla planifolia]
MDGYVTRIQIPFRFWGRRVLFLMCIMASFVLVFHTFTLPYRNNFLPQYPKKEDTFPGQGTSIEAKMLGMLSLLNQAKNSTPPSANLEQLTLAEKNNISSRTEQVVFPANITNLAEDMDTNLENLLGMEEDGKLIELGEMIIRQKDDASAAVVVKEENDFAFTSQNATKIWSENSKAFHGEVIDPQKTSPSNNNGSMDAAANSSSNVAIHSALLISSSEEHSADANSIGTTLTNSTMVPFPSTSSSLTIGSHGNFRSRRKKAGRLPATLSKMKDLMLAYHSSHRVKESQKRSARVRQLLAAKALLEKASAVEIDEKLYAPAFWNVSNFQRSYDLMEQMLKIYVYKEGNKPVFHQPLLRGIYASEGWLMKLLQNDRHFVVRDHRKAHLFYMPFSSRLLQLSLYVRNSHSHRNLAQHLKNYVDLIAAKYSYWNRTSGADHFLAACHDWAPHITGQAMNTSIHALCNADLRRGFQPGKDVSLPEIYVRSARDPLRDLGGHPPDDRPTLAFYAGNLHGRLRPVLLRHWENKDPDMRILGPMPPGVESKMAYIQHMKSSRYCICPRGYEVNSPRVVESIYYECVPVLISDDYVPPFFEVLNWEAFAVVVAEEDVPRLKEILVSIPEEKYRLLQMGVRRVQRHFLWHGKPVKYDLFHMVLHSIWFNRLGQLLSRKKLFPNPSFIFISTTA